MLDRRSLLTGAAALAAAPVSAAATIPVSDPRSPLRTLWDARVKIMYRLAQVQALLKNLPMKIEAFQNLKSDEDAVKAELRDLDEIILRERPSAIDDVSIIALVVIHWERTSDVDVAHYLFEAIHHVAAAP